MQQRLAISCPHIGVRSETFIRRHIEGLCPGETVAIANKPIPVSDETWSVDCPVFRACDNPPLRQRVQRQFGAWLGKDWGVLADRKGVRTFLREQYVDVLLGQYLDDSWPLIDLARKLGVRFFAHAHGYDLSSTYRDPVWRKRYADYRQADGIIVVNHLMKERLLSIGLHGDKIHVVPCGVDVPDQPIRRSPREVVKCLAVGRMVAKKAPLKLLEVFREASARVPCLHLDYVGTGRLYAEAVEYVEQFDLSDRVTLHGGQPNEKVLESMMGADIFLQHSMLDPETGDEEGMPVAVLEAMAMALPVLSTRHAGIPEAVDHGVTGLLVEEGDVKGMAAQLVELASTPTLREMMGRRAWARARERFSWAREKAELQKILGLTC